MQPNEILTTSQQATEGVVARGSRTQSWQPPAGTRGPLDITFLLAFAEDDLLDRPGELAQSCLDRLMPLLTAAPSEADGTALDAIAYHLFDALLGVDADLRDRGQSCSVACLAFHADGFVLARTGAIAAYHVRGTRMNDLGGAVSPELGRCEPADVRVGVGNLAVGDRLVVAGANLPLAAAARQDSFARVASVGDLDLAGKEVSAWAAASGLPAPLVAVTTLQEPLPAPAPEPPAPRVPRTTTFDLDSQPAPRPVMPTPPARPAPTPEPAKPTPAVVPVPTRVDDTAPDRDYTRPRYGVEDEDGPRSRKRTSAGPAGEGPISWIERIEGLDLRQWVTIGIGLVLIAGIIGTLWGRRSEPRPTANEIILTAPAPLPVPQQTPQPAPTAPAATAAPAPAAPPVVADVTLGATGREVSLAFGAGAPVTVTGRGNYTARRDGDTAVFTLRSTAAGKPFILRNAQGEAMLSGDLSATISPAASLPLGTYTLVLDRTVEVAEIVVGDTAP